MRQQLNTQIVIRILFLGWSLAGSISLPGQSFSFLHYTIEDGLPSTEVHDVHQSADGYIWMATDHGLVRFDGRQFEVFTTADGLTDNTVFDIIEERSGRIWLTTYSGGLSFFENGKVQAFKENERLKEQLDREYIDQLVIDSTGQKLLTLSISRSYNPIVWRLDSLGNLSPLTQKERLKTQVLKKEKASDLLSVQDLIKRIQKGELLADAGRDHLQLSDGRLLFSSDQFLYEYIPFTRQTIRHPVSYVLTMYEDADGDLWIGGKNLVYIPRGDFREAIMVPGLEGKVVSDILEDDEKNLWVSTIQDGVYFLPHKALKFFEEPENLPTQKILSFAIWQGALWMGSYDGFLYKTDSIKGLVEVEYPEEKASIFDLLPLGDQGLLVSNKTIISPSGTSIQLNSDAWGSVKVMESAGNGILFTGGIKGLEKVELKGGMISVLEYFKQGHQGIFSLYMGKDGRLWIGTAEGLLYKKGQQTFSMAEKSPLFTIRVNEMLEDREGLFYMATKGNGVLIYEEEEEQLSKISLEEGLLSNFAHCLLVDPEGALWVGTNRGLNKILRNKDGGIKSVLSLTVSDGLPSEEINELAWFEDQLWVATSKGVVVIQPEHLQTNNVPPKILFTGIHTGKTPLKLDETPQLTASSNDLQFQFAGLSFQNSEKVRYRYRLKGFADDWQLSTQPSATFTNLKPGDYTFEVTARNKDGVWNPQPAVYSFVVLPHFTETWWFFGFVLLAGVTLLFLTFAWIVRRREARSALDRRILESEQKALRAQINPHFIFNAMNSIQFFITENDKYHAGIYLSRFSKLMRRILDNSKKNWVTMEEELAAIRHYLDLERLRFDDQFDYAIEVDDSIDIFETELPSMITQPFLENAIWHGLMPARRKGTLKVDFFPEGEDVVCRILDNGIGRGEASKIRRSRKGHRSTGIQNVEERLHLLNQQFNTHISVEIEDLFDSAGKSAGTQVWFRFPARR
jgi:ligand-binding sensor domain-containing protein